MQIKNKKYFSLSIFLGIFFLVAQFARANTETDYSVIINQDTAWTKETPVADLTFDKPVIIEDGATLTIEKGTGIVFLADPEPFIGYNSEHPYLPTGIRVANGKLVANGTQEESIIFTSPDDGFSLSFLDNSQVSFMRYVKMINGGFVPTPEDGDDNGGDFVVTFPAIAVEGGKIHMENSKFINSRTVEINIADTQLCDADGNLILDANDNVIKNKAQAEVINSNFSYSDAAVNSQLGCWIYDDNTGQDYIDQDCVRRVHLKDNWYGNPAGPTIINDTIEDVNIVYNGYIVSGFAWVDSWRNSDEIIDTNIPNCTENCFSNVLFLPGLEASRLYREGNLMEDQLWEPNADSDAEDLFLDSNGKSLKEDIYTRDIIDEVNISPLILQKNIYKSFESDLKKWKNDDKIINDYLVVPYDWRLSLNDILVGGAVDENNNISYTKESLAPYIIRELKRLAENSRTGKVTIIAHSNGGLVAKALVNKLGAEAENLIDKIVFVAVPQLGTPQAIGGLLHGFDQGIPYDWFYPFLSPKTARQLAENMPSVYNLLPSEAYFNSEGSETTSPVISFDSGTLTQPFIDKYGNEIKDFDELQNFLNDNENKVSADSNNIENPSILNHSLIDYGKNTHETIDDNWTIPASISVYQIAGFGEETLGTVKYWTGKQCVEFFGMYCLKYQDKLQYTPNMVIDGDGTVVAPSALAMSTSQPNVTRWWVDLDDYNKWWRSNIDRYHADIFEVPELRDFIKNNILTQSTETLPNYISTSKPEYSGSIKRLQYILHSPLALSAHDSAGNEISSSIATIPGARYKRFGEVQYISLPANISHTVVLDGIDSGSFTLEIQEAEGDNIIADTTFAGIPSSDKTIVTMNVIDGTIENASPLEIDYDGDNDIDFSLEPIAGETVSIPPLDQTPPEAKIFFDTGTKSITVEGIDENPTTVVYSEIPTSKKNQKQKDKTINATITDEAGNTTIITYIEKFSNRERRSVIEIKSVSYNGVVTDFNNATLKYKWNNNKKDGAYKMFVSHIRTASKILESHYRPKKDLTIIMTKPQDLDDNDEDDDCDKRPVKEKISGMVVSELVTNQGEVSVNY